ncbi:putative non-F420 flavinoid oxidoreductase [Algoriphagus sp. 4150]|uniref:TIGR03885 family FMN-dependent LLM class oxidoreductase n=1 Tax=Algoriphagus sp. 4150 TaxID=2817756 RepID=UPI0028663047|nr:TIGR03885 family FMN-dependent LLM class oxidoreductase [Algoriphagus sp. 4150]MDR7127865.1 putative non-F420 flavinoid oxidoreductase [Algoriphagus sp. 4150]
MKIGFHASQEQFSPSHLLHLVLMAEEAGFRMVTTSDHFHPWSERQGQSGFAWSWLGAAMQATSLEYGIVNAPGQRYHPAVMAQAVATLLEMFPGRFWMAAGSGQALNENITGERWPSKAERNKRLYESVAMMRELWRGDYVNFEGTVKVENAKLFTRPNESPCVYGAALTEATSGWLGEWADGLITISRPLDELKKLVKAFTQNGGEGKPLVLKMQVSYAENEEKALEGAWDQWRNNIFPSSLLAELNTPAQFDELGQSVRKEDMAKHVLIGSDAGRFTEAIREYAGLGFSKIIIHNVNKWQEDFISFFGKEVLPDLKENE